ncbi:MAG TPA: nucleoside deaminase [Polyangiales bacterium]
MPHTAFLRAAIDEALHSVRSGGGPFGAVVVHDGKLIAKGRNRVTSTLDPTAHAEVVAIRAACAALQDHRLTGATLYSSTEPCPLCLAAVYWARIERVYFAATREDAARAGFDDAELYRQVALPTQQRSVPFIQIELQGASAPLDAWTTLENKALY